MTRSFDYVIAGAGSAGCTLAARLAEDPDVTVCLVDAGGWRHGLWSRMPAGNGFLFGNPTYDWGFYSVPQEGLAGRRIYYPRGKGIGGSSLINGMIYMRGCAGDYDRWRQKGLRGWSYAEVLPYFRRSCAAPHRAGDPFHGTEGPLKLTAAGNFDRINEIFVEACREAGNPLNEDFNGIRQEGVGRIDVKVWGGRRQSTAAAYLRRRPTNLTVLTGSHVTKVAFSGKRATGLALAHGEIRAEREVILSLGAFGSPQCLMLSGIGPADHLSEQGIEAILDLPGVGSTLYDHPQMPVTFELMDRRLSLARLQRLDRAVATGLRYLLTHGGPGAAPFWSSVLFRALRDHDCPELMVYFTPMCVQEEEAGWRWSLEGLLNIGTLVMSRGKKAVAGVQLEVLLQRPRSHGTLRLDSADPLAAPRIDPCWFTDPQDMAQMLAGLRHVRQIMRQPSFRGVVGRERQPGLDAVSDRALEEGVRRYVTTGHHPVSTCRMGADNDPGAVLDEALRVRGIEGLRVVDASSFPDQVGGNTNAPVIMLAEKAADLILGRMPLARENPRERAA